MGEIARKGKDMVKDATIDCNMHMWIKTQQRFIKRTLCSANPKVVLGSTILAAGAAASLLGYIIYQKYYKPGLLIEFIL